MSYSNYLLNGSRQIGAPEESYLYSDSTYMGPQSGANALGSAQMASSMAQPSSSANPAQAAATGAAMGGPSGAAIAVGGQFLMQHMAQRAAEEEARKQRAVQIEAQYGQDQNKGFDSMMRVAERVLR